MKEGRGFISIMITLIILATPIIGGCLSTMGSESRAPLLSVANVHVNVTYPDETIGSFVYARVHQYEIDYSSTYANQGVTNSTGQCRIPITYRNLGPCFITLYNFTKSSFSRVPLYIWPEDEIYIDVVLHPALPNVNKIFGYVKNRSSGAPTSDVTQVKVVGNDLFGRQIMETNTTDVDGYYEISVPNSTDAYSIEAKVTSPDESYLYFSCGIFLSKEMDEYEYDIYLNPTVDPDVPVNLHFVNSTTGKIITRGYIDYEGYYAYQDNSFQDPILFTGITSDGWFNTTLGIGEYIFNWRQDTGYPMKAAILVEYPLIVNTTEITHEIPIPIPNGIRDITLRITDYGNGAPISDASVSYQYKISNPGEIDTVFSDAWIYSNFTGIAEMGILPDTEVDLSITCWGYNSTTVKIEPGSSSLSLDITMNKSVNEETPFGNISILVTDEVSGFPVPRAYIDAIGFYDSTAAHFGGYADYDGYFNQSVEAGTFTIKAISSLGENEIKDVTIAVDVDTEVTIPLQRRDFPDDEVEIYLTVRDPNGIPIPHIPISVAPSGVFDTHYYGSDKDGKIIFAGPPGQYNIKMMGQTTYFSEYRSRYIVPQGLTIDIPEGGSASMDITAYPTHPLQDISGFVRDMDTNEVLPFEFLSANSIRNLNGESTRSWPDHHQMPDKNRLTLYSELSGSGVDGLYRVWGMEEVELTCEIDGYFPHFEKIDLSTRTIQDHDILMEPLKEYTTWVNGTLLGESDDPVEGDVFLYDLDRNYFEVNRYHTGMDGNFFISTYPGNFLVYFRNFTLDGEEDIEVTATGLENLELHLIPHSKIEGVVKDQSGSLLEGINVTLNRIAPEGNETIDWAITDGDGLFEFSVIKGIYRLIIVETDDYNGLVSDLIIPNGWFDFELELILDDRDNADVHGNVLGENGPYEDGIPGATLLLKNITGDIEGSTFSDINGAFSFEDVLYGLNYTIEAIPPSAHSARELFYRSGYTSNSTPDFEIVEISLTKDVVLPYFEYTPGNFFNITGYGPKGADIPLDEPIRVWFSEMINISTFVEAFSIEPMPDNLIFRFSMMGTGVTIYHADLEKNTTYVVKLKPEILSDAGAILWDRDGIEWNFTTGTKEHSWSLFAAEVSVNLDRSWNVSVTGWHDQDVFIVIEGIGSFPLTEHPDTNFTSEYREILNSNLFLWNHSYFFHFSDMESGNDLAMEFSGWRRTPFEFNRTDIGWELFSGTVTMAENGDWIVNVTGNESLEAYIVIDGIGSFLLTEVSPGVYAITIHSSNFESQTDYSYYFSDRIDGEDLAENLSGHLKTKKSDEEESSSMVFILLIILAILLIIAGIFFLVIGIRKKGESDVESWDIEE